MLCSVVRLTLPHENILPGLFSSIYFKQTTARLEREQTQARDRGKVDRLSLPRYKFTSSPVLARFSFSGRFVYSAWHTYIKTLDECASSTTARRTTHSLNWKRTFVMENPCMWIPKTRLQLWQYSKTFYHSNSRGTTYEVKYIIAL